MSPQFPNLQILWLDGNMLSGEIPPCIMAKDTLQQLQLAGNRLSGSVPPLPDVPALTLLDLSNNKVRVRAHARVHAHMHVCECARAACNHHLRMCRRREPFQPPPPKTHTRTRCSRWPQMDEVDGFPGLNGTLPRSLINADDLTVLSLGGNSFTGRLPALPSALQTLEAQGNRLTGSIPRSLASPSMRVLDLSDNNFNGEFLEGARVYVCGGGTVAGVSFVEGKQAQTAKHLEGV